MTRWNLKHLVRTTNRRRRTHSILLQIPYWQKPSPQNHQAICFQCNTCAGQTVDNQIINNRMIIYESSG